MKNAVILFLQLTAVAVYADVPAPRLPPPAVGMGTYMMVLWPAGAPVSADPTALVPDHREPDVTKLGGTVLYKKDQRRIITLPLAAANELRKDEAVVYLQRLWMGESLVGWEERYVSAKGEFVGAAQDDTNVLWGPEAYAYDGSGNIKQTGTDQYTYDSAGRLIQSTIGGRTESFKYDSFGNLIEKQVSGANATTIAVDGSSNRMLGVTYDAAGNAVTAQEGRRTYEYDSFNMMTRVRSTAAADRRMVYDADDERIGMVVVGDSLSRWTIRDFEGRIAREFKADSLTYWIWEQDNFYGEGSLLGGETQGWGYTNTYRYGGKRHYHLDHLGSVRVVTDNVGRSLSEHDYSPFGTTMTRTYQEQFNYADPHIDAMRFAGQWRDFLGLLNVDNTEYLDYMHARYYDPNLGRFGSVDPFPGAPESPQSWNRYVYARNSPLRFSDPSGKQSCTGIDGDTENQCKSQAIDPTVEPAAYDPQDPMLAAIDFQAKTATAFSIFAGIMMDFIEVVDPSPTTTLLRAGLDDPTRNNGALLAGIRVGLYRVTGTIPPDSQAHHIFPTKFRDDFERLGIDWNNPEYGAWWQTREHQMKAREYNQAWEQFLRTNPSRERALMFGKELAESYGLKVIFK